MVAGGLHRREIAGGIPVEETGLAGARDPAQQQAAHLAQAAMAPDGIQLVDEGLQGGREEKGQIRQPQLAVGQLQAAILGSQMLAQGRKAGPPHVLRIDVERLRGSGGA